MFSQNKKLMELLISIDESHLKDLGYTSLSLINEAKAHTLWKPKLVLKRDDIETIIEGESDIVGKLKEIYNEINK